MNELERLRNDVVDRLKENYRRACQKPYYTSPEMFIEMNITDALMHYFGIDKHDLYHVLNGIKRHEKYASTLRKTFESKFIEVEDVGKAFGEALEANKEEIYSVLKGAPTAFTVIEGCVENEEEESYMDTFLKKWNSVEK